MWYLDMKKVLMIAYQFPPISGGGVYRTIKFVKYLPSYDWEPIILTVKKSKFASEDLSLKEEMPDNLTVFNTNTLESRIFAMAPLKIGFNRKWYQIPDYYVGWLPFAVKKGKKIIKKEKPDLIYSTSSPVTSHLIAMAIKNKTGIPWVADFRDPWTQNFNINYPTRFHKKFEENLERKVVLNADRIISVSDPYTIDFRNKYSDQPGEKFVTISNGYDNDDFNNIEKKKIDKFIITHIGSFYNRRSPLFFLKALRDLLNENTALKKNLEVRFVGKSQKNWKTIIDNYNLDDVITESGYKSHSEALELMVNSSCLLLIISVGEGSKGVFTGKIFEYLASKTPILATIPLDGVAADLIRKSNSGIVVKTDDVKGIGNAILSLYNRWKTGNLIFNINSNVKKTYDRKELTKKLAQFFNEVIE